MTFAPFRFLARIKAMLPPFMHRLDRLLGVNDGDRGLRFHAAARTMRLAQSLQRPIPRSGVVETRCTLVTRTHIYSADIATDNQYTARTGS